ncbi:MAG: hypothetical protein JWN98_649, partial [Abditibacteriota bacterium]|nr:hypothetical protein [Abditibacteriota bacterium]
NTRSEAVRNATENLLLRVSKQVPDEAQRTSILIAGLSTAPLETRASILKALGAMGGVALSAVRAELNSADPKMQDLAIRALTNTPDAQAMPDLLQIAASSANPVHRTLALRGYLRLAEGVVSGRGGKPDLGGYAQALKIATGTDDKKSVLAGLSRIHDAASLALIVPLLGEDGVRNEAALAALGIARNIRDKSPQEARSALERIVATSKDEEVLKQANDLMKVIPSS